MSCTPHKSTTLHSAAILDAFESFGRVVAAPEGKKTRPRSALAIRIEVCRSFIANKVPCGDYASRLSELFVARIQWNREPMMTALFHDYIAAGYIDVNAILTSQRSAIHGALALELAIIGGNLGSFEAYLRAGADVRLVPSQDWSSSANTRSKIGPITDILSFIDAKIPIPEFAPKARTLVTEEVMRRAIVSTSPDPTKAEAKPPSRRKPAV